ncbi:hypothetical protein YC2023_086295 [Brassica napus]
MGVTVTVGWTGGGNLQDTFPNDGIVARWFSLVPSDVFMSGALSVGFSEAAGAVASRFEGTFLSVARGARCSTPTSSRCLAGCKALFRYVLSCVNFQVICTLGSENNGLVVYTISG